MNTQSTQRFVSNAAPHHHSALRRAAYRFSAQLNDLLVTLLRSASLLVATLRFSAQLNDLLVTTSPCRNSTLLDLPHRIATSRITTQRFVSDAASRRFAPQQLAPLLNSTHRFVSNSAPSRSATPHRATRRFALQLGSTQRFVSNSAPFCTSTIRGSTPLNSTQRFVSNPATSSHRAYTRLCAPLRCTPRRNAHQLNEIA